MTSRSWLLPASLLVLLTLLAVDSGAFRAAAAPSRQGGAESFSTSSRSDRVRGSFIVDLVDGVSPEEVARDHGGRAAARFDAVIGGFQFSGSDDAMEDLRRDPRVENIHRDLVVRASAERWPTGVQRINARHRHREDAHDLGVTGKRQLIAILDTGIDLDHPDLRVNRGLGKDCVGQGRNDRNGHGTHVAGIAGGLVNGRNVVGVAPSVQVVPVRVLDNRGVGSVSSIICGVNHLTRIRRDGDPFNDILTANMSLNGRGGPGHCNDGGLREAVCRSVKAGVLYTASAGNNDHAVGNEFPGNFPEVVTVSAFTDFNNWPGGTAGCRTLFNRRECDDTLWTRSNFGWQVDVTAPGVLIKSDAVGGGMETRTGTSQAAPHAAGVAALIRELRPDWSPGQIRNHMRRAGECPNGQKNGTAWWCNGKGRWKSDPDKWVEPLVNARWAVKSLL